jgi:hypothetical protein
MVTSMAANLCITRERIGEQQAERAILLLPGQGAVGGPDRECDEHDGPEPREQLGVDETRGRGEVAGGTEEGGAERLGQVVHVALKLRGAVPDARIHGHEERNVSCDADGPDDQAAGLIAQALEKRVTKHRRPP